MQTIRSFIDRDVRKATISISDAEDGRNGPIWFFALTTNSADMMIAKIAKRLAKHGESDFCYETSGCGDGIHLTSLRDLVRALLDASMHPMRAGQHLLVLPSLGQKSFTAEAARSYGR